MVPHVLPLTSHPFVRTRVAAFRILHKHGDHDTIEACLTGLGDVDQFVREMAWKSLKRISGKSYRFPWDDESSSEAQRQRAAERWRRWWSKEKSRMDREAVAEAIAREAAEAAQEEGDNDS